MRKEILDEVEKRIENEAEYDPKTFRQMVEDNDYITLAQIFLAEYVESIDEDERYIASIIKREYQKRWGK